MADSDSDHEGSDGEGEGFDPTKDMDKLSEKEKKKWEKRLAQWRIFMDFLFRHVTIVTYKFNSFESEELTQFMIAMEKAEALREQKKLKKKEVAQITSIKGMKEASELLAQQKFQAEANRLRTFLNMAGRMRGLGTIAAGFYKAMKKGKLKGVDKVKYYLDYWKGFTVRSFDYSELSFRNGDPDTFNALEKKYLVWPTVVKTAINLSQKFLKKSSEASGLELINADVKLVQKYLEAPEFVLATNIEDSLLAGVAQEAKSVLSANPLLLSSQQREQDNGKYELPDVSEIDPSLLKPIPDTAVLMSLPAEPPKEKKKGRKGKKGKGGKGKKAGRSSSASSHKGGKKKKR